MERWHAGDFVGCLASLATQEETGEAVLLRSRALLRLERAGELIDILSAAADRFRDKDEIATAAMLIGAGYARERKFERAFAAFRRARAQRPHQTILAETAYYNAVALYQLGDVPAARAVLVEALNPSEDIVYVRALYLAGLLLAAEEKFAEATEQFERALDALERCRATDLGLLARIVHLMAVGQAEGVIVDPSRLLELVSRVPWTSAVVLEHVQTLRHIGLAFQRQGYFGQAARCFAVAATVSPGGALAAMCLADLACNSTLGGDDGNASAFTTLCLGLVETVDWSAATGEARCALVDVAMLMARRGDGAGAQRWMALFDERRGFSSVQALSHDSREATFERHARALVAAASGREEYALRELRHVDEAWGKIRYEWRAIEARSDMLRLRNNSALARSIEEQRDRLLARGREVAEAIAESSSAVPVSGGIVRNLTPTQVSIIKLLMDGHSTREMATGVGHSEQTVRNHFRRIYSVFGLENGDATRAKLIAKIRSEHSLKDILAS